MLIASVFRVLGTLPQVVSSQLSRSVARSVPTPRASARSGTFELRVADVVRETSDSVTLVLDPGAASLPSFRAGQYLRLTTAVDGAEHTRAYSISARESAGLRVTVKAVESGTVSRHLCTSVEPGHVVRATGPHGSFVLPEDRTVPLCFLAVGSGITPVLSMIATALERDGDRRIRLVYANRSLADVIFAEPLDELVALHPSFDVVHVLTRPARGWAGERGRLTGERAADLLAPPADAHVYVCGPQDLTDAAVACLRSNGVDASRLHRERFTPRDRTTRAEGQQQQSVSWARSGIDDVQRPGETLLAAAIRVDADVAFICEAGECGECKVRILSGDVIHEPDTCLTREESAQGLALACSTYAVTDVEVDA